MISNHKTLERVERLELAVYNMLQSFQIGRYAEKIEPGVMDVPMFGIRFKFIDAPKQDDEHYQVVHIPNEDFLDEDKLFLILCSKGYIHWLRDKLGSHAFMQVLAYKDRWVSLVEAAIEKSHEERKGQYLIGYFESFLNTPFLEIYHENPEIFDWMIT